MSDDDATVLFAYDGSEYAAEAIREAGRRLRPGPALVLTAWQGVESIAFGPVAMSGSEVQKADHDIAAGALRTATEGAELCRETGFEASPIAEPQRQGAWATIVSVADKHDVALIVLGSHGRTGAKYLWNGSVATAVSHHAKRPVLIVTGAKERSGE